MASTLTRREERVVDDMVRIAGSEQAFERAVTTLQSDLGRAPNADQLLDYLLERRIESLQAKLTEMEQKG
jgi:hypothetical protein